MNNAHFQRGLLLFQQGRYQEAVGELRMHLGAEAEDSTTHALIAQSLSELEQHDEATQHAQRAIHLAPDEAFGHYALARVMINRRRYSDARHAVREAIRLDPFQADYFGILALLELENKNWRQALAAADQGLAIDPEHGLCTNLRAQALVKLGDRAAAAATMGEALARSPDDGYTHANQGWALLHAGEPRKALEHFREALRLEPGLEFARAGIVEALKARNFVYRWMLAWFLWMSRLKPGTQWMLVIGAFVGSRMIRQWARNSPELAPVLWLILYLYIAFVVLSWLSSSFFNLLLRFDRFGRYALSPDQVRGANVLLACLMSAAFCLGAMLITRHEILFYGTLMFVLLSLPASAIYVCDSGWPRQAMMTITLLLLGVLLLVITTGLFEDRLPPAVVSSILPLIMILPLAMLASQFAANYLAQVTPRK